MLNCVYHPIEEMRVVDNDERDRLLATGVWFDHPLQAKAMLEEFERQERQKMDVDIKKSRKKRVNQENE